MKNKISKRINKSKEELLKDLKGNEKFQEKMKFTREVFYPALCEATVSIDDACILLGGFNTVIMQEFLALMKDKTLKELNLGNKLDPFNMKLEESKKLLALFEDMSVFDAKDYIEGMRNEIQLFLTDEAKERPLSSLKTKWVDQL